MFQTSVALVGWPCALVPFTVIVTDDKLNCVQTPLKAPQDIETKYTCVLYWGHYVQPPGKFVLYDAASKTTYQLDDQNLVQPYVAAKVEVTGTLSAASKTIKVAGIKVDWSTVQ